MSASNVGFVLIQSTLFRETSHVPEFVCDCCLGSRSLRKLSFYTLLVHHTEQSAASVKKLMFSRHMHRSTSRTKGALAKSSLGGAGCTGSWTAPLRAPCSAGPGHLSNRAHGWV